MCLGELFIEKNVQPHMVEWENFVVSGDHGQGAFRVAFRCIVKVFGSKELLYKTASVSDVYCRKDTGEFLKNTILDWMTEDLKIINDSKVVIKTEHLEGGEERVVCNFIPRSAYAPRVRVLTQTEIYVTGILLGWQQCLGRRACLHTGAIFACWQKSHGARKVTVKEKHGRFKRL